MWQTLKFLYNINILLALVPILLYLAITVLALDDIWGAFRSNIKIRYYQFDIITYIWIGFHLLYLFIILT